MIAFRRRRSPESIRGKVVAITGGSRGLGLLLAREFAREGCRVAICARDADELDRAKRDLEGRGAEVLAVVCDVGDREEVHGFVGRVLEHFGPVDILVNNAGIIEVGPIEDLPLDAYERAMATMYWGTVYPTFAVLPSMRARGDGRIVNITSIGGKLSIPHLAPYSSAKFAAVGFSEGLRAELPGSGVSVTTVVPGLMRTGSHLNARFGGRAPEEATWFALGATLPGITIGGEHAARAIVDATRRRRPVAVLVLAARAPSSQLTFDIDLALSQSNDNPVYYIQYAHARACSVLRKLADNDWTWRAESGLQHLDQLTREHERVLLRRLDQYPEAVALAARSAEPHLVATYLRELAGEFHTWYNAHKILVDEQPLRDARVALSEAVKQVIANGLELLGVSAPEAM